MNKGIITNVVKAHQDFDFFFWSRVQSFDAKMSFLRRSDHVPTNSISLRTFCLFLLTLKFKRKSFKFLNMFLCQCIWNNQIISLSDDKCDVMNMISWHVTKYTLTKHTCICCSGVLLKEICFLLLVFMHFMSVNNLTTT